MLRWTFHILTLMSLVLMIASCVAWVRSYGVSDFYEYHYNNNHAYWYVSSAHGDIEFSEYNLRNEYDYTYLGESGWTSHSENIPLPPIEAAFLGISLEHFPMDDEDSWTIRVPHFWVAYIFAGLPILWCFSTYRRVRVKRRLKNNLCVACGYDLQGSGGKCPECGTVKVQSE